MVILIELKSIDTITANYIIDLTPVVTCNVTESGTVRFGLLSALSFIYGFKIVEEKEATMTTRNKQRKSLREFYTVVKNYLKMLKIEKDKQ